MSDRLEIERVGVVGAGTMGSGIAEVCARSGVYTMVVDVDDEYVAACRTRIEKSLDKSVGKGQMTSEHRDSALELLGFATDLDALSDRDLVVEAIIESEPEKISVFQTLDKLLAPHALIASNTSSIPIIRLAKATQRADKVLGMHFFNPAPVQPLVEIVRARCSSDQAVQTAYEWAEQAGKRPVKCNDTPGFIVNRILIP
ncbi:MAG TPA: 3-hydroxyacyl-CoA dehydrogenase NAD-binding domain-containing protein, partial [Acidimicrobiales bacterium]|nr:3-hydroxyacyl-CoA dehydrogenase NAD-binding domain-containing protein [Acidimicrobiales bacterium]